MRHLINFIRRAAAGYEPVVAAQFVAAAFTLAAGLGLAVGDLPEKVNALLAFVGVVAPIIAGAYSRQKVTPVALVPADPGRLPGDDDLHPEPSVVEENPDDDLLEEPGQHKRLD